jgi:hypothetical protein
MRRKQGAKAMNKAGTFYRDPLSVLAIEVLPGCASEQTKTMRSTTTTTAPAQPQATTTTTTETTKSQGPDSVLGATAHAVGTVILFPFGLSSTHSGSSSDHEQRNPSLSNRRSQRRDDLFVQMEDRYADFSYAVGNPCPCYARVRHMAEVQQQDWPDLPTAQCEIIPATDCRIDPGK